MSKGVLVQEVSVWGGGSVSRWRVSVHGGSYAVKRITGRCRKHYFPTTLFVNGNNKVTSK